MFSRNCQGNSIYPDGLSNNRKKNSNPSGNFKFAVVIMFLKHDACIVPQATYWKWTLWILRLQLHEGNQEIQETSHEGK